MAQTLHFPAPPDQLAPVMGELIRSLKLGGETPPAPPVLPMVRVDGVPVARPHPEAPPPLLRIANGLWAGLDTPVIDSFRTMVADHYDGTFRNLDFRHDPAGSRQTINAAVEHATVGRIRDLVGDLDPETKLVVTNAVYLKASWLHPFDQSATVAGAFLGEGGRRAIVPLMRKGRHLPYEETDSFQAVAIPYFGRQLSMLVVLPRENNGLGGLEAGLTPAMLADLSWRLQERNHRAVDLTLPKFELEDSFELAPTLRSMGMTAPFSDNADFSGLALSPLGVSAIFHKTFVGVDENGTEAAAATAMWVTTTFSSRGPPPPPPVVFRADHPFLFAIRDDRTGLILFMGRFSEPGP